MSFLEKVVGVYLVNCMWRMGKGERRGREREERREVGGVRKEEREKKEGEVGREGEGGRGKRGERRGGGQQVGRKLRLVNQLCKSGCLFGIGGCVNCKRRLGKREGEKRK
jgi:hypothetical protein